MQCFKILRFNCGECIFSPQESYREILLYTIDARTQDSNPQPHSQLSQEFTTHKL